MPMKRRALTLTLILALSALIVGTAQIVNLAVANPTPWMDLPTEPIKTSPTIVMQSPTQNQTYNSTNVWLNFTVVKPETWFKLPSKYGGVDSNGNPLYLLLVNITSVYYFVDCGKRQDFPVHDNSFMAAAFPNRTLDFSTNLTLAQGVHNITVSFEADSYYLVTEMSYSSIKVYGSPEIINFTISKEPEPFPTTPSPEPQQPEPFPTTLVIAVSIVSVPLVGAGLLVYRVKFKKPAKNQ
jgi:hypothetical protein